MAGMEMEVQERVDMKGAEVRYALSATAVKNRLAAVKESLELEAVKEGGKNWLSGELLEVMDGIHAARQSGGTQEEYLATRKRLQPPHQPETARAIERSQTAAVVSSKGRAMPDEQAAQSFLVVAEAVAERLAERLVPRDPLAGLESLERAVERGWVLSSSQVSELIGVVPRGKEFGRHGFTFHRAGKVGAQSGWKVKRHSTN